MFCNPLNFITDIKYVKILILSHCLYIWMFINLKFKKKNLIILFFLFSRVPILQLLTRAVSWPVTAGEIRGWHLAFSFLFVSIQSCIYLTYISKGDESLLKYRVKS